MYRRFDLDSVGVMPVSGSVREASGSRRAVAGPVRSGSVSVAGAAICYVVVVGSWGAASAPLGGRTVVGGGAPWECRSSGVPRFGLAGVRVGVLLFSAARSSGNIRDYVVPGRLQEYTTQYALQCISGHQSVIHLSKRRFVIFHTILNQI